VLLRYQPFAQVRTEKTGASGDKNTLAMMLFHDGSLDNSVGGSGFNGAQLIT
jgi:hypothetical protein